MSRRASVGSVWVSGCGQRAPASVHSGVSSMSGQLVDIDSWIAWLEALRQVSVVVVPMVAALVMLYVIAGVVVRWRWRR